MKALKKLLKEAYARGFAASGKGYNQDYPFDQHDDKPQSDAAWRKNRDKALKTLLEESKPSPRQNTRQSPNQSTGTPSERKETLYE